MPAPQTDAFSKIKLAAPDQAAVEFYPYGGHITSWTTPDGRERMFLSTCTELRDGVPIRGGVPIAFPQFSRRGPLPPHGFARTMPWTVVSTAVEPGGSAAAHLQLLSTEATRALWDHDFQLDFRIAVSGSRLSMTLQVTNTGDRDFAFNMALHTYLCVSDISAVTVEGLGGLAYSEFDQDHRQPAGDLRIVGEVDRIYWDVPGAITLHDGDDTIQVTAESCTDTVVWNPGPEKSAALTDMDDDGYQHMLCIEAAAIGQAVTLAPAASWRGTQHLEAGA